MASPRGRLRWTAAPGGAGQLALFDAPERLVGHGGYRGLEFVHVRARSIINTLLASAPLSFRHTAVVRGAVGAGATSVSSVLLHLRPGVHQHYLGWLARARPDLVALHERRYAHGSYAARAERERVAGIVRAALAGCGRPGAGPDRPAERRFAARNLRT